MTAKLLSVAVAITKRRFSAGRDEYAPHLQEGRREWQEKRRERRPEFESGMMKIQRKEPVKGQ